MNHLHTAGRKARALQKIEKLKNKIRELRKKLKETEKFNEVAWDEYGGDSELRAANFVRAAQTIRDEIAAIEADMMMLDDWLVFQFDPQRRIHLFSGRVQGICEEIAYLETRKKQAQQELEQQERLKKLLDE